MIRSSRGFSKDSTCEVKPLHNGGMPVCGCALLTLWGQKSVYSVNWGCGPQQCTANKSKWGLFFRFSARQEPGLGKQCYCCA